jgi:hypothetical protein
MSRPAERASHARHAIADQLARIETELDQLHDIVGNFDPRVLPEEVSADWIKGIIHARRRREEIFPDRMFGDPAWDLLLVMYAGHLGNKRRSVTPAESPQSLALPA